MGCKMMVWYVSILARGIGGGGRGKLKKGRSAVYIWVQTTQTSLVEFQPRMGKEGSKRGQVEDIKIF